MNLVGLLLVLVAHPLSVSSSRVVVDGARVEVQLRCQGLTLVESVPVDEDGDRRVSREELDASRAVIERYLLAGYRLTSDLGDEGSGTPLKGRFVSATLHEGAAREGLAPEPLIDFVLQFEADAPLRGLRIDENVFRESDPLHRDHAQIVWNGRPSEARVLWVEDPSWTFRPEEAPRGVLASYVSLGIEHIATGYDHIAFVIALVVASRRMRSILGVVTAFTLAHSITLAAASMGYVNVSPRIVEPMIAASIAYVAVRNLLSKSDRTLWPEAFGFGLVHGLGFAGSIAETLAGESQKLAALFGFNAGVEIGQLAVVGGLLVVLWGLRRVSSAGSDTAETSSTAPNSNAASGSSLAPHWVRIAASAVVAGLGAWWFVQRVS